MADIMITYNNWGWSLSKVRRHSEIIKQVWDDSTQKNVKILRLKTVFLNEEKLQYTRRQLYSKLQSPIAQKVQHEK